MARLDDFKVAFTTLVKIGLVTNIPEFTFVELTVSQRVVVSLPLESIYEIEFVRVLPEQFTTCLGVVGDLFKFGVQNDCLSYIKIIFYNFIYCRNICCRLGQIKRNLFEMKLIK